MVVSLCGCRDYQNLSIEQICTQHVERMGQDAEQLQIIALIKVLGVSLGILDVAHSEIGYIKHSAAHEGEPAARSSTGGSAGAPQPPDFWVCHMPGHYDIVYPRRPFDVRSGMLVEVA